MKGNGNFVDEKEASKEKVKDEKHNAGETELKIEDFSNDGKSGESKPEDEPKEKKDLDLISQTILRARLATWNFCVRHGRPLKIFLYVGLNILMLCYVVAAVLVYINKGHQISFWDGLGLLIVLYALFYGGLFYYFVLKRYIGSWFVDHVYQPAETLRNRLWRVAIFKWFCCLIPICAVIVYLFLDSASNQKRFISFSGIIAFTVFGFVFSESPGHVNWRPVYSGLILQFFFALITLKWETGRNVLQYCGDKVAGFLAYTNNGTAFVYGPLVDKSFTSKYGSTVAFSVLPVIFFFAFFVNILSYYNILQWFILKIAWGVQIVMGTTVCESVNAAASIFLGATESILLFKNQLKDLTKSELHAIMCEGWATVAGTVLAAFISFGISPSHLIAASVMSAPAALSYSKLFYPEREKSKTTFKNIVLSREQGSNLLDAACRGALAAITIVASIIANIVAFLAFMAFIDSIFQWLGVLVDFPEMSFRYVLTKLFVPVSYLMGVDTESVEDVALLIGTKTFVNEFAAYELMGTMKHKFSPRTEAIATFALCGFSNFASIGIFIGVMSALEPSQASNTTEVSMRAFIAANIVCFITACVAGTLMDV